jgi:hypothetical protein
LHGRTTPFLRLKSITFFFLVPASTELFSKEKRIKKKAKEAWEAAHERHKSRRVAAAIMVAQAHPDISFAFLFILLSFKGFSSFIVLVTCSTYMVMGSAGAWQCSCGAAVNMGKGMSTPAGEWMNRYLPHCPISDIRGKPGAAPISGKDLERIARAAGNGIIIYHTG